METRQITTKIGVLAWGIAGARRRGMPGGDCRVSILAPDGQAAYARG